MEDAGWGEVCVHAAAPQTKACRSLGENVLHVSFSKNLGVSLKPTLDFVATTNACASLLTKTLGVDRSNPCGPLSRNYACVSLGNVATCLLAKTRRRSPTNPPRTPGPSNDLPASGALAAMDNVGGDPCLSSAPRDQNMRIFLAPAFASVRPRTRFGVAGSRRARPLFFRPSASSPWCKSIVAPRRALARPVREPRTLVLS